MIDPIDSKKVDPIVFGSWIIRRDIDNSIFITKGNDNSNMGHRILLYIVLGYTILVFISGIVIMVFEKKMNILDTLSIIVEILILTGIVAGIGLVFVSLIDILISPEKGRTLLNAEYYNDIKKIMIKDRYLRREHSHSYILDDSYFYFDWYQPSIFFCFLGDVGDEFFTPKWILQYKDSKKKIFWTISTYEDEFFPTTTLPDTILTFFDPYPLIISRKAQKRVEKLHNWQKSYPWLMKE